MAQYLNKESSKTAPKTSTGWRGTILQETHALQLDEQLLSLFYVGRPMTKYWSRKPHVKITVRLDVVEINAGVKA